MMNRLGWALSGALALVALLALGRALEAGSLDPPGPVGSTMRTLDELVPSWGKTLSSSGGCTSQRFQCVMAGNAAVLDRETGLVWQRTPDAEFKTYELATTHCHSTPIGGRYGWRLPTLTELWSLADDSGDDNIPDGSPFIDVGGGVYWSSTLWEGDDQYVVALAFFGGFLEELTKGREGESEFSNTWCVRGGQSLDDDARFAEQPAWSRALSSEGGCESQRFECVMNGAAVLDRETGLVWERTPGTTLTTWRFAQDDCREIGTGGRRGWRLPRDSELSSLVDPALTNPTIALPAGHPFNVSSLHIAFWSSTSVPGNGSQAVIVNILGDSGGETAGFSLGLKDGASGRAWCVRGGEGIEGP
jgi:hypothetical protein